MALPLAHGLVGASIVVSLVPDVSMRRDWRLFLTGALVAVLPDFDYIFYLGLQLGNSWHRSFSHSILFALAVGIVASSMTAATSIKAVLVYSLATVSHPILDALTTKGAGGVEFFWPISNHRFRFGIVDYPELLTPLTRPLTDILIDAIGTSFLELAVFGALFLVTLLINGELGSARNRKRDL